MADVIRLAVTPGEPAGIGPDLAIRIAQTPQPCELVAIADPELLQARARLLGLDLRLLPVDYAAPPAPLPAATLRYDGVSCAIAATPGRVDPANARYVLETLTRAVERCRSGACAAVVTGPVHKAVINRAGIAFTGHTGFLAKCCGGATPVMMLTDGALRVALATVHLPLSEVPAAITRDTLTQTLRILTTDLERHFGLARPRILVAGLNPHAGENGYLGDEEIDIIAPAIEAERARGTDVTGPLPADTLFTPDRLQHADVVLAMYHDQGLPVIKHAGFGRIVNVTLGLPIIRTSVDHGTALDRAGQHSVHAASLQAAIDTALVMVEHGHGA